MSKKSLEQSIQMPQKSQADGYLTVYLSLSITIILALILALLQGARVGAVKMKSELVADIAVNSVMGEYNRALFDKYGLLMIDDSFCTGSGSITKVEDRLSFYFSKNFEPSLVGKITGRSAQIPASLEEAAITGFSLATDGEGAILRRQIISYMEAEPIEGLLLSTEKNVQDLKRQGYDELDVEEEAEKNQAKLEETYEADTDDDGESEELSVDDPAGQVNSKKGIGVLPLAAPDYDAISSCAINPEKYISHRNRHHGTGLDESEPDGLTAKALFEEYLFEKCGCYGRENEEGALKYELEYIYGGKESDYANLNKVVNTLFFWREASNYMYLLGDSEKLAEAEALALTASIILCVPELEESIKASIIFAWTFAESVSDLHILLSGGKVPLIKDSSSWQLSLTQMLSFGDNLKDGGGSGLDYEGYLRMLLFMKSKVQKTDRLMDVIEMNIRKTEGNSEFCIDSCVDIFRTNFKVKSRNLELFEIERTCGYERE